MSHGAAGAANAAANTEHLELVGALHAIKDRIDTFSAAAVIPARLNTLYWQGGANLSTVIYAEGELRLGPILLPPGTYSSFAWEVTTAGSLLAVTRGALYEDDGDGAPKALVWDTGTVDSTTTGTKEVTGLTELVVPTLKLYWGGVVNQGGATTRATLRFVDGDGKQGVADPSYDQPGWSASSVTGAVPDPWTSTVGNQHSARIAVKRTA